MKTRQEIYEGWEEMAKFEMSRLERLEDWLDEHGEFFAMMIGMGLVFTLFASFIVIIWLAVFGVI